MKILIAQSGGPTAVINATLAGSVESAKVNGHEIIGGLYGIEGILKSKLISLPGSTKELNRISRTPGVYLGSCRYRLPDPPDEIYDTLFTIFKSNGIDAFLYIGGNDSMDSVSKISKEARRRHSNILVGGIPKTVDNDLVETDHCPGYPSAAKFLNIVASEFIIDSMAYSKPSICVIETMGRDSGWLAASLKFSETMINGLKVITLLPEIPVAENEIIEMVGESNSHPLLISVSEGIRNKDGKYFSSLEVADAFGHPKLGGAGEYVSSLIEKHTKVKFVNPYVLQRSASHIVSEVDYDEAKLVGSAAVDALNEEKNAFFIGIERKSEKTYSSRTKIVSIEKVANKVRQVPVELIGGAFIDYIKPLIGDMPRYAIRGEK